MRFFVLFIIFFCPLFSKEPLTQKKVVLVLGSGGSKGIAHIGVLEELNKLGIVPNRIIGCSSGAIVGALYAQNKNIEFVKSKILSLSSTDLIDYDLFFSEKSFSKRRKLADFIERNLQVKTFEELEIELITVATNFKTGNAEYFSSGSLKDALLASSALPVLFPPYQIGDKVYIDGGCSAPLPVCNEFCFRDEKDVVIIVSDVSDALDALDGESFFFTIKKSFEIMYHNLAEQYRKPSDIILKIAPKTSSPIDDEQNDKLYKKGREVVLNQKDLIQSRCFY